MAAGTDDLMRTARQHHQAGRHDQAETLYRQIISDNPNNAEALHLLGVLAYQTDNQDIAIQLIGQAIAVKGEWAEACFHLGLALQQNEQFDEAIGAFRRAIVLDPNLSQAHYYLGTALQISGQRDKAIAAYTKAIALCPDDAVSLVNLGIALHGAGRFDEAVDAHRRAIAANPKLIEAYIGLGNSLREKGELDQAIEAYQQAIALKGDSANGYSRLANALWQSGRIDEALTAQQHLIALRPDNADAHLAYAQMLLLKGDFANGWPEFQWRWRRKTLPWPRRKMAKPLWDGGDLAGQTILLHAEGSNSDTIQFIRYIPLVLKRGGKVIVECQPGLRRLLEENWAIEQWVSPGEPLPPFDVYSPLLNLPLIFGTTLQNIPSDLPHWGPDEETVEIWKRKIGSDKQTLKVGLAWAGSPSNLSDGQRSTTLRRLSSLAEIGGVAYYSLQKGRGARQLRNPMQTLRPNDFTDELTDFADTAGLISQLDLVISVDTAVAHLAGAMGKRVWLLLPFVPDWRWMLGRDDSPWYPSMRLFRQSSRGDWAGVIDRVAKNLVDLCGGK